MFKYNFEYKWVWIKYRVTHNLCAAITRMAYFEVAPVGKARVGQSPGAMPRSNLMHYGLIVKNLSEGSNLTSPWPTGNDPDRWRPPNARSKKSLLKICRAAVPRSDKWKEGDSSTISTQRRPSFDIVGRLGGILKSEGDKGLQKLLKSDRNGFRLLFP